MAYTNFSEAQLLRKIAKKDEQAFKELYHRYHGRLYRYFKRVASDSQLAQDLLQELFIRLIAKAHLFNEQYKFSTWIYTMAYHVFINHVRKKSVIANNDPEEYERVLDKWDDQEFNIYTKMDRDILLAEIDRYLERLDTDKRQTFILRFQEDLNISEIAEIMDCPPGTVKSRLHYIIKQLAPQLAVFKDI